jgi:hypothetical protein
VQDLKVTFSGRPAGNSDFVFGEVYNQSSNRFGCAQVTFDLANSSGVHLGVVSVDVPGLGARHTTQYETRLPFPTSKITLKSVMHCQGGDILSFTAESMRIRKGDGVTLQWRTANARSVSIGVVNPEYPHPTERELIFNPGRTILSLDRRNVEASGSLRVFPSKTTTFRLEAGNWAVAVKDLTIEVTSAPAVCTISGRVMADLDKYGTVIRLVRSDNPQMQFSANVSGRQYTIPNVPEGSYRVSGKMTRYTPPAGSYGLGVFPQRNDSSTVTCENGRVTKNLEIRSVE